MMNETNDAILQIRLPKTLREKAQEIHGGRLSEIIRDYLRQLVKKA
jgi:hypothetical protein